MAKKKIVLELEPYQIQSLRRVLAVIEDGYGKELVLSDGQILRGDHILVNLDTLELLLERITVE
jgi:hypothetical protein